MTSSRLNDGCSKIFKLLDLLYSDDATYENVLELFKDDIGPNHSRNHAHVVINKYLNTLKVFGIKVEKINNNFKIKNDLYTMKFSNTDIRAMSILSKAIMAFPDDEICQDVTKILNALKLRMDPETKVSMDRYLGDYDFTFYYTTLKSQIDYCQNLINEAYIFEIMYKDNDNKIKTLTMCKPIELIYDSQNAYFRIHTPSPDCRLDIALNKIMSIKTMPNKRKSEQRIPVTVVYTLKGRLANAYKLKDHETSPGLNENGHLIVINRDEPLDNLLPRLLRYMDLCEIKTPKLVRTKMVELIESTIEKYQ